MQSLRTVRFFPGLAADYRVNIDFLQPHDHDCYEFLCTVKGKGMNVVNDEIQILEARVLTLTRPEDVHFVKRLDEYNDRFEFFNIQVPVEFMQKEFALCTELEQVTHKSKVPSRVKVSNTELGVLCSKVFALNNMPPSQKRVYLYYKLIQELCACMVENKNIDQVSIPEWFSELIVKIEHMDIAEVTYELMLEMSNVSSKTLWKAFRRYLDVTPTDYLGKRRADAAYDMIMTTDLTYLEIAMGLNYGSYVQFYRAFTKYYNISPRDLRKRE